jgi:hypothetical protein
MQGIAEFVEQVDLLYGHYLDCVIGFNHIANASSMHNGRFRETFQMLILMLLSLLSVTEVIPINLVIFVSTRRPKASSSLGIALEERTMSVQAKTSSCCYSPTGSLAIEKGLLRNWGSTAAN